MRVGAGAENPEPGKKLEFRLRALVPQPVSDEDASLINQIATLIELGNQLPSKLGVALNDLKSSLIANNNWLKAAKEIGSSRKNGGRNVRSVLRLAKSAVAPPDQKTSPKGQPDTKDARHGATARGHGLDSVTAACVAMARRRAGRLLRYSARKELATEFCDRFLREAQEQFLCGRDGAEKEKVECLVSLVKGLNVDPEQLFRELNLN